MASPRPDDAPAREARVIARYLLDVECPPELAARYAAAIQLRPPVTGERSAGARVCAFTMRHPWSLPYISAAAPFLRDGALLRSKLTLMTAILETTPRFASEFLPREHRMPRLVWILASQSLLAAARLVVGVPLLLFARVAG